MDRSIEETYRSIEETYRSIDSLPRAIALRAPASGRSCTGGRIRSAPLSKVPTETPSPYLMREERTLMDPLK
jgi:hypothetical protein